MFEIVSFFKDRSGILRRLVTVSIGLTAEISKENQEPKSTNSVPAFMLS